ncbi:MAG: iron chelate uptake ABC transporter family permease subunit [Terriglobia bacterium]
MLLNRTGFVHSPRTRPHSDETITFQIRLPRAPAAALVGAALAVAGVLFQGLFRNPLKDKVRAGWSRAC